jgi:hypothetical protein
VLYFPKFTDWGQHMAETPNKVNDVQETTQPKKAWHAPQLEETRYTATEAGGIPGVTYDGLGNYSIV